MICLIGEEDSKRTIYMKKAAETEKIPIEFLPWSKLNKPSGARQLEGAVIKIDPPSFQTACFDVMKNQLEQYQRQLQNLQKINCGFLNSPEVIQLLLDKRETKRQLQEKNISVTRMFSEKINHVEELLDSMKKKRCHSIFIKPRFFSGAAGVTAFRMHPANGRMKLYTSSRLEKGQLVNTKKILFLEEDREIKDLLEALLSMDCIVERWHPKAEFQGKSFDLRVVYQFGHVVHMVVRQSSGPITNLHLNNQAMDIKELGLSLQQRIQIEELCQQSEKAFEGFNMAGIDIMLEKGSIRPLIIEMNGQGDLIYQDIFGENRIYGEQIRKLQEKEGELLK